MKLACNDGAPVRQLLDRGRADVDFLKVTDIKNLDAEVSSALRYRPALIHVGFGIGDSVATYKDFDWDEFNGLIERSGSPHVAMHLEVSTHNWLEDTDLRYQTADEARAMAAHLTELWRFLRGQLACPLLLENMDYSEFQRRCKLFSQTLSEEGEKNASLLGRLTRTYRASHRRAGEE